MKGSVALCLLAALVACKPPPTDETLTRAVPEVEPAFASTPLPSPGTEGALWARSAKAQERIVYGVPGEAALIALACDADQGTLSVSRFSPADKGAQAMLALVGNGHVGRLPVNATEAGSRRIWQGTHDASREEWEPLAGPRRLIATLPGAGTVEINPSPLPMEMIEQCRSKAG